MQIASINTAYLKMAVLIQWQHQRKMCNLYRYVKATLRTKSYLFHMFTYKTFKIQTLCRKQMDFSPDQNTMYFKIHRKWHLVATATGKNSEVWHILICVEKYSPKINNYEWKTVEAKARHEMDKIPTTYYAPHCCYLVLGVHHTMNWTPWVD